MKKVFKVIRPYRRRIAVAGLCSLVVSGTNGSIAWLVKPAVDRVLIAGDRQWMALVALSIFVVFVFRGVFSYIQNYLMKSVGAKLARDMRNGLYSHMLHLPMSHFAKDPTGAMLSMTINDIALLQDLLAYKVRDFLLETGTVVALIGVAFYMRWDLTLIALTVLPLAFYFTGRLGKRLKKVARRAQEKISGITESISEGLSGVKVIKSFTAEEVEARRFGEKSHDHYRELMRSTRIYEATTLIMDFTAGFGIAFVLWYGSSLVIGHTITAGEFFAFLTAVLMIYTPAKRLTNVNNALQQAKASLERIDGLLGKEREPDGTREIKDIDEIVFEGVSFRYEGKEEDALSGLSLAVKKGEVLAIAGRSGSGKTTLVDLIAGFYSPAKGSILINGIDIRDISKRSLRSLIGIVSQEVVLFNDTVRANIAFGRPDAAEAEIIGAAKATYAHDFITDLPEGYDTPIGEGGIRLSGGQRQRLSIARAILRNPPLLILDEATSALDTQSELLVRKALDNLMRDDRTTLIISHRPSTIKRATRIMVLDRARLIESGSHKELMDAGGLYSRLYNLQFDEAVSEEP